MTAVVVNFFVFACILPSSKDIFFPTQKTFTPYVCVFYILRLGFTYADVFLRIEVMFRFSLVFQYDINIPEHVKR